MFAPGIRWIGSRIAGLVCADHSQESIWRLSKPGQPVEASTASPPDCKVLIAGTEYLAQPRQFLEFSARTLSGRDNRRTLDELFSLRRKGVIPAAGFRDEAVAGKAIPGEHGRASCRARVCQSV